MNRYSQVWFVVSDEVTYDTLLNAARENRDPFYLTKAEALDWLARAKEAEAAELGKRAEKCRKASASARDKAKSLRSEAKP